jgi:hypothetical protein
VGAYAIAWREVEVVYVLDAVGRKSGRVNPEYVLQSGSSCCVFMQKRLRVALALGRLCGWHCRG